MRYAVAMAAGCVGLGMSLQAAIGGTGSVPERMPDGVFFGPVEPGGAGLGLLLMSVRDGWLYVNEANDGGYNSDRCEILDIRDPSAPIVAGTLQRPAETPFGEFPVVAVEGDLLVATTEANFHVMQFGDAYLYDNSTRGAPTMIGPLTTDEGYGLWSVNLQVPVLSGSILAASDYLDSFYLFDLQDPANPVQLVKRSAGSSGRKVRALDGDRLLMQERHPTISNVWTLSLLDVSDPTDPVAIRDLNVPFAAAESYYGTSVAMGEDLVAVSGSYHNKVELFDARTGIRLATILNPSGDTSEYASFGQYLEIAGGKLFASDERANNYRGAVYQFALDDPSNPVLETRLVADTHQPGVLFGSGLAADDSMLVVVSNTGGDREGTLSFFSIGEVAPLCPADFDGDNDVDFGDFGFFVGAFDSVTGDANYDGRADFDGDGDIDFGDFGAFVSQFDNGPSECEN